MAITFEKDNYLNPMQRLTEKLDSCILPVLRGKVVFLDYPVHGNVSDILIWFGAKIFFKRNNVQIEGRFGLRLGHRAHQMLADCFLWKNIFIR